MFDSGARADIIFGMTRKNRQHVVLVRVSAEARQALDRMAELEGMSRAAVIDRLLRQSAPAPTDLQDRLAVMLSRIGR